MNNCPICGTFNGDDWPIAVDDKIFEGCCQDCWENHCDETWWEMVEQINKLQSEINL